MNRNSKKFMVISVALGVVMAGFIVVSIMGALAPKVYAQTAQDAHGAAATAASTATAKLGDHAAGMAFMAAAIVMGSACVAAGVAVGMTGSAAIGAIAERPELMGRMILIVGLAEGIAIYGLIIAIMILDKV
jgi:V/A-type H+-transporting ATPase subunit K